MIFVHELTSGRVDDPSSLRAVSISPFNLPEPLRSWLVSLWQKPVSEWTFKMMLDALFQAQADDTSTTAVFAADLCGQALEQVVQAQKLHIAYLEERINAGNNYWLQSDDKIRRLEEWSVQLTERLHHLADGLHQSDLRVQQKEHELAGLYMSSSWRVTSALRWASRKVGQWRGK